MPCAFCLPVAQAASHDTKQTRCHLLPTPVPLIFVTLCLLAHIMCRAPSIYEKQVRPVFEAAGCQLEMHLTEARHHATGITTAMPWGWLGAPWVPQDKS